MAVNEVEVADLYERIVALHSRLSTVQKIRLNAVQHKAYGQKYILASLTDLITKDLKPDEIHKKVSLIMFHMDNAKNAAMNDQRSFKVLVQIIKHPRHLPLIVHYIYQLDPQGKIPEITKIKTHIGEMSTVFKAILDVSDRITSNLAEQVKITGEFARTASVGYLTQYMQLLKQEQKIEAEIAKNVETTMERMLKLWRGFKSGLLHPLKAEHELIEHHKIAVACFSIGLVGLTLLLPVLAPAEIAVAGEAAASLSFAGRLRSLLGFGKATAEIVETIEPGVKVGEALASFKEVTEGTREMIEGFKEIKKHAV